jgi:hypothetical protein
MSKKRCDHRHAARLSSRAPVLHSTRTHGRPGARPSTPPLAPRLDGEAAARRVLSGQLCALGLTTEDALAAIGVVWRAWEAVSPHVFVATTRRESLAALVVDGWFARLAQACHDGRGPDSVTALMLLDPSLKHLKNFRQIAMRWIAPLRLARTLDPETCVDPRRYGPAFVSRRRSRRRVRRRIVHLHLALSVRLRQELTEELVSVAA